MSGQSLYQAYSRLLKILETNQYRQHELDLHAPDIFKVCECVVEYYGYRCELPKSLSPDNPHEVNLRKIAHASQFLYRRVSLTEGWTKKDVGPLIGFIEDTETPCAFIPSKTGGYFIMTADKPKPRKLTTEMLSQLSAVAYMLYIPLPQKKLGAIDLLRSGIKNIKTDLSITLGTQLIIALLSLITPLVTGYIFQQVVPNADIPLLLQIGILLSANILILTMFMFFQTMSLIRIQIKVNAQMQPAIWERLLNLPVHFFRQFSYGDLVLRALGINEIQQSVNVYELQVFLSGIFSMIMLIALFFLNTHLASWVLFFVVLMVLMNLFVGYFTMKFQYQTLMRQGKVSSFIMQILNSISKIRLSNSDAKIFSLWANQYANFVHYNHQRRHCQNISLSFNLMFSSFVLIVIYYLAYMQHEHLSFGTFIAFNSVFIAFSTEFINLLNTMTGLVTLVPHYQRMVPIIQSDQELDRQGRDPGEITGRAELKNVTFRYDPQSLPILDNVSIDIQPGEFVAIVGPSGAGKSSIFRLMLGFEEPEAGKVLYDGYHLKYLNIKMLREQIGVVLQNDVLFPGTILENILGYSNESKEIAWHAAQIAAIDKEIKDFPMGMHTMIAEGATSFSGGQRQRLLLARALARQPKILLLDEATSALDNIHQRKVKENLEKIDLSRLVIAHRLSTITFADRIFVLKESKVIQTGSFKELIAQPGFFQEMAHQQKLKT